MSHLLFYYETKANVFEASKWSFSDWLKTFFDNQLQDFYVKLKHAV